MLRSSFHLLTFSDRIENEKVGACQGPVRTKLITQQSRGTSLIGKGTPPAILETSRPRRGKTLKSAMGVYLKSKGTQNVALTVVHVSYSFFFFFITLKPRVE